MVNAVTGPFSYTDKYVAEMLLGRGARVRGFVRPGAHRPHASAVDCRTLQFQDLDQLARDLDGVDVLYNTYWIRFEHGGTAFADAVENTQRLARAAQRAGVRRIVHVSVSNPSHDSPFAYFRGKAAAEDAVTAAGVPVSIVRPTLVFGREDVLINNMAWLMRRLPVFPVFGGGEFGVQPVFVGDVAELVISEAANPKARVIDAAGPDVFRFADFLRLLRSRAGGRALLLPMPASLAFAGSLPLSAVLGDVLITREEIGALMAGLLVSNDPPTTPTSFLDWAAAERSVLGRGYTSELQRHWSTVDSAGPTTS